MATITQKVLGKAGKALTSVGRFFNAPQLVKGGLGAAWQSFGGQKIRPPEILPKAVYAAEKKSLPGSDFGMSVDPYRNTYQSNPLSYNLNQGQVLGTQSGGTSDQGQSQGGGGQDLSNVLQQEPGYNAPDFDAMIQPALASLDAEIAPLQAGFTTQQGDIEAKKKTQLGRATQDVESGVSEFGTRRVTEEQEAESAANEARRQFSEIQRGLQSRYGRTTGTGAFSESYLGAQAMRNIGQIRQKLTTALSTIDDKIFQVREIGKLTLQEIEDKATEQINSAKEDLNRNLAEIRRAKGELQGRKAELAANAIQYYQQSVQTVRANNAKFKQDLYLKQVDAENKLAAAKQKVGSISSSFQPVTYKNLLGEEQIGSFNKRSGEFSKPSFAPVSTKIGQTDNTDDYERYINQLQSQVE